MFYNKVKFAIFNIRVWYRAGVRYNNGQKEPYDENYHQDELKTFPTHTELQNTIFRNRHVKLKINFAVKFDKFSQATAVAGGGLVEVKTAENRPEIVNVLMFSIIRWMLCCKHRSARYEREILF